MKQGRFLLRKIACGVAVAALLLAMHAAHGTVLISCGSAPYDGTVPVGTPCTLNSSASVLGPAVLSLEAESLPSSTAPCQRVNLCDPFYFGMKGRSMDVAPVLPGLFYFALCGPLEVDAQCRVSVSVTTSAAAVLSSAVFAVASGPFAAATVSGVGVWSTSPVVPLQHGFPLPPLVLSLIDLWGNAVHRSDTREVDATASSWTLVLNNMFVVCESQGVELVNGTRLVFDSCIVPTSLPVDQPLRLSLQHTIRSFSHTRINDTVAIPIRSGCTAVVDSKLAHSPLTAGLVLRALHDSTINDDAVVIDCGTAQQEVIVALEALDSSFQSASFPARAFGSDAVVTCELYDSALVRLSSASVRTTRQNETTEFVHVTPPSSQQRSWLMCELQRLSLGLRLRTPATLLLCNSTVASNRTMCQSLSGSLDATETSLTSLRQIPLWYQSAPSMPIITVEFVLTANSEPARWAPTPAARKWILVPNRRYRDVPIGYLASFVFGASYCKIGRIVIELKYPLCDGVDADSASDDASAWVTMVTSFLGVVIANTTSAAASSYVSIDAVVPDLQACYDEADMTGDSILDYWGLSCFASQSSTAGLHQEPTGPTPGAVAVMTTGVLVGAASGGGVLWFVLYTMRQLDDRVKLTDRKALPLAVKSRIVFAHLLAPFVILAHAYTIYGFQSIGIGSVLFGLDLCVAAAFYVVAILRVLLPKSKWITPVYLSGTMILIWYTSCLLAVAGLWGLAALSVDVRVVPYATACVLILLQLVWQVKWCGEELAPSVSVLSSNFPHRDDFVRTTAPINGALSLEMYAVVMMLFMFAVTQVQDITAFMAVMSSFTMVAYSFLTNYSISRIVSAGLREIVGSNEGGDIESASDGVPLNETGRTGSSLGRDTHELLARLLEKNPSPIASELSKLSQRIGGAGGSKSRTPSALHTETSIVDVRGDDPSSAMVAANVPRRKKNVPLSFESSTDDDNGDEQK